MVVKTVAKELDQVRLDITIQAGSSVAEAPRIKGAGMESV
jgi:hypothetical protein